MKKSEIWKSIKEQAELVRKQGASKIEVRFGDPSSYGWAPVNVVTKYLSVGDRITIQGWKKLDGADELVDEIDMIVGSGVVSVSEEDISVPLEPEVPIAEEKVEVKVEKKKEKKEKVIVPAEAGSFVPSRKKYDSLSVLRDEMRNAGVRIVSFNGHTLIGDGKKYGLVADELTVSEYVAAA